MPKWMQAIDTFSPGKRSVLACFCRASNPKNLALTLAAATAIAQTGIAGGDQAIALAVFVLLGSLILAPVAIYFAMGARATEILDGLKSWLARTMRPS